ncbi:MAG: GerW family sporulation protein [Firmicutes bacterium]|nr:GerW family sporulation protein [Bacillota bacterium]
MSELNSNLEALFSKMEGFVNTKTVVGDAMTIGDVIIVPLVEVMFGVGAGSTDNSEDKNKKQMGAGGLGAKIAPTAIMVIQNGTVQLVNVKDQSSVNKLIDMVPGILSKLNLSSVFESDGESEEVDEIEE